MSALDLDIGDLASKLFKKGGKPDSPSPKSGGSVNAAKIKPLLLPIALVGGVGAFIYLFLLPEYQRVEQLKSKAELLPSLQLEVASLTTALGKSEQQLTETKMRYAELTKLFHTEEELEDLYRHISTLALTNGLTITGLTKQAEIPVLEVSEAEGEGKKGVSPEVAYYTIPMKIDFSGSYLNYVRFRDGLAAINKLVNIDQEKITVLEAPDKQGMVEIKATVSTYRMPERYMNLGK